MKKTIFAIAILATIFTACGTPAKEETTTDSTAVATVDTAALGEVLVDTTVSADTLAH